MERINRVEGGEIKMNAHKVTLAQLLNRLDQAELDTGHPQSFKLRPDGELTIIADVF